MAIGAMDTGNIQTPYRRQNMIETVKKQVRDLLESGKIASFLGLSADNGHIGPHLFNDPGALENLSLGDARTSGDSRYPLIRILTRLARRYPQKTFGVLVRGCDERGLKTLYAWNQLDPSAVVPIGIVCPQELADSCQCLKPYSDNPVVQAQSEGCNASGNALLEEWDLEKRFAFWMGEFSKCIKCYGCRNICPMCFCQDCSLAQEDLVTTGTIPPDFPIFHLARAVHMAGRCIDCGLCNDACPAGIPLRALYKKVADIMEAEFDFRAGISDRPCPLNVVGRMNE